MPTLSEWATHWGGHGPFNFASMRGTVGGFRVASDVFSTRASVARMLGSSTRDRAYGTDLHARLAAPTHPHIISSNASWNQIELTDLPVTKQYPVDALPSITGGIFTTSLDHAALRRAVVLDADRLAVWVHPTSRGYKDVAAGAPAAMFIGSDPVNYIDIRSRGNLYGVVGDLTQVDGGVLVPHNADIVIAGVLTGETVELGPFTEWHRLLGHVRPFVVMQVGNVLAIKNPCYLDIYSGGRDEAYGLGQHDKEAAVSSFPGIEQVMQAPWHPGYLLASRKAGEFVSTSALVQHIAEWLHECTVHYVPPLEVVDVFPEGLVDITNANDVLWAQAHLRRASMTDGGIPPSLDVHQRFEVHNYYA